MGFCHKTSMDYSVCKSCGGIIIPNIKTKAEERLIKAAFLLDEDFPIDYYPSFHKAALAVRKERKKKK